MRKIKHCLRGAHIPVEKEDMKQVFQYLNESYSLCSATIENQQDILTETMSGVL